MLVKTTTVLAIVFICSRLYSKYLTLLYIPKWQYPGQNVRSIEGYNVQYHTFRSSTNQILNREEKQIVYHCATVNNQCIELLTHVLYLNILCLIKWCLFKKYNQSRTRFSGRGCAVAYTNVNAIWWSYDCQRFNILGEIKFECHSYLVYEKSLFVHSAFMKMFVFILKRARW